MREIKFRAWDKLNEEMATVDCFDNNHVGIKLKRGYATAPRKDCVLMQYTGLKDKNGKEIYEGDIVFETGNGKRTIKWIKEIAGFGFRSKTGITPLYNNFFEVIGNIYENPNLLTEEK
jgi:uncharacterized phage protein (TIGR01671 family)